LSSRRLLRWVRRAPLAGEALIAYARARWRIARIDDARALVVATRGESAAARGVQSTDHLPEARRVANAIARTLSLLPSDPRCMDRSLVLIDLLARREIPATLVIGARRDPGFRAHAWVELAGHPLLSPGDYAASRLVEL
jgi:hypothetical protein